MYICRVGWVCIRVLLFLGTWVSVRVVDKVYMIVGD